MAAVGKLIYGDTTVTIELDDRTLAHLQVVISAKLRRGEGFFLSWNDPASVGDGRGSVWLDSSIPLYFRFRKSDRGELNREWLEDLSIAANHPQGLRLTEEPGALVTRGRSVP